MQKLEDMIILSCRYSEKDINGTGSSIFFKVILYCRYVIHGHTIYMYCMLYLICEIAQEMNSHVL